MNVEPFESFYDGVWSVSFLKNFTLSHHCFVLKMIDGTTIILSDSLFFTYYQEINLLY